MVSHPPGQVTGPGMVSQQSITAMPTLAVAGGLALGSGSPAAT